MFLRLCVFAVVPASGYTLDMHTEPPGGVAGEAFAVQPVAKILDNQGNLDTNFFGYAYAELYESPTGTERLLLNETVASTSRVPIQDGYATFSGLYVNAVGEGYRLRVVGEDSDYDEFAFVVSGPFDIVNGPPYALELVGSPSSGAGGTPFSLQPFLRIVDVGGNLIPHWNVGSVDVSINKGQLLPETSLNQPVRDGRVQFDGLYVNQADQGYVLSFQARDLDVLAQSSAIAPAMTISVGLPQSMTFVREIPPASQQRAGHPFETQPILQIRDAAGNIVNDADSSLLVKATILTNPTGTAFISADDSLAFIDRDKVYFSNLGLESVGERYAIRFSLLEYRGGEFVDSGVFVDSRRFDVVPGPPYDLKVLRSARFATAGGTAFPEQPIVAICDRGGNILTEENNAEIEATVASSLSTSSEKRGDNHISVDTSRYPPPSIIRIFATGAGIRDSQAAVGDELLISIVFESDVALFSTETAIVTSSAPPKTLDLLVGNESSKAGVATFVEPTGTSLYTSTPTFKYVVKAGDSVDKLDVLYPNALGGVNAVRDPLGRVVNSTLPIGSSTKGALANTTALRIDTRIPIVRRVALMSPETPGTYAAGTDLIFEVTFSHDVLVEIGIGGGPYLPLSGLHGSTITEDGFAHATYVTGSDTASLIFLYSTRSDENTADGYIDVAANASLVLPIGTTVRRRSSTPTTDVDLFVNDSSVVASSRVMITTSSPRINETIGVVALSPDGRYFAGDVVDFAVEFTQIVQVSALSPPVLLLNTGVGVAVAAEYLSGTATKRLVFRYTVSLDDSATLVDTYDADSLQTGSGWIRRAATNPLVDADLGLHQSRRMGNALSNRSAIEVDGKPPIILSYWANTTNTTLVFDAVVDIQIEFNKPVAVLGSPGIRLDCGSIERVSTYTSGNGSTTLHFGYVVQVGDATEQLGIATSVATIAQGLTTTAFVDGSSILLASTNPVVEADLTIRFPRVATRELGSPLFTSSFSNVNTSMTGSEVFVKVNAISPRPTTVVSVSYDDPAPASSVGAGERIVFNVEFTDEVSLFNQPPELQLNTGARAIWLDGSGSKVWRFRYVVEASEMKTDRLDVAPVSHYISSLPPGYPGNSALWCNASLGCNLYDRAGNSVNLTMLNLTSIARALRVDNPVEIDTMAPRVADVWCRTPASPYAPGPKGPYAAKRNWYSVGERLEFALEFDRPVTIESDEGPLLHVDLGPSSLSPYATFEAMETDRQMRFSLSVQPGDATENLTVVEVLNNLDQAQVYRKATSPTTLANYTLPPHLRRKMLGANGSDTEPIIIATDRVPRIVDVRIRRNEAIENNSSSQSHVVVLAPGDDVAIDVVFDASVAVFGVPVLILNLGKTSRAYYLSGTGTPILTFAYTVSEGDATMSLDYTDTGALRRGFIEYAASAQDQLAARATIRAASSSPTLDAALDLAAPGFMGSLSDPSKVRIVVDPTRPAVANIQPRPTAFSMAGNRLDDEYNTPYETIYIEVTYTAAVAVSGTPQIRLETGAVDRAAAYVNGSNTTSLLFAYKIQPGDSTARLEYYSDVDALRTSAASLEFPTKESWIRRAARMPTLDADSRLNPVYAGLVSNGATKRDVGAFQRVEAGVAYFPDLSIVIHAVDYVMRFACVHPDLDNLVVLRSATVFDVDFAVDTVLRLGDGSVYDSRIKPFAERNVGYFYSHAGETLDLFGWNVDVLSDAGAHGLLVAGAPGKPRPLPEIQLVTLVGGVDELTGEESELEVQSYGVGVFPQAAVQSFVVYADPRTILDGTFEIIYADTDGNELSAGAHIPVATAAVNAANLLMDAYPDLGLVTATKTEYEWCACTHGANWSITFDGLVGVVPRVGSLRVDVSNVMASGAVATPVSRDVETAHINGTWRLELPPTKHLDAKRTRVLRSDASIREIRDAIELDLAPLTVKNVDITDTDSLGGRRWAVTFSTQQLPYFTNDIPLLKAVALPELLKSGPGANAWSYTVRNGSSPVTGSFTLKFRDPRTSTPLIPYNASADVVRDALLTLPSIASVQVSRHEALLGEGLTWRVTFLGVLSRDLRTSNKWVDSPLGDLEKIQVGDVEELLGTSPAITVSKYNDVPSWAGAQKGSRGIGAGSAYIYSRETISAADTTVAWNEEFALETQSSDDYNGEGMGLGHSVAFAHDTPSSNEVYVLVGAPWAEYHGVFEQQLVACTATSGSFRLGMRGFWTDPIPWNFTVGDFTDMLVGKYGRVDPLHSVPNLDVAIIGGLTRVCVSHFNDTNSSNYSTRGQFGLLVTFMSPPSGPGVDGTRVADIEPFNIDATRLHGVVNVTEVVKGTRQPHGIGALGDARGAAFLYRRTFFGDSFYWQNVAKLVEHKKCRQGDRFGWVVTLVGSNGYSGANVERGLVAAIGTPSGGPHREGYVFIFSSATISVDGELISTAWARAGEPLTSDVAGAEEGDEFGYSLAMSRSNNVYTLVVGAPGDDHDTGAAYVYKAESVREALTGEFLFTQRVDGNDDRSADTFPRAAGDRYGCSVAIDGNDFIVGACGARDVQFRGAHFSDVGWEVGVVAVFQRDTPNDNFVFVQRLRPTNAIAGDRFGTSIAVHNGTIAATGLQGVRNLGEKGLVADAPLTPRMEVWSLETSADSIQFIGGTFRVGWRSLNSSEASEACAELPFSLIVDDCENVAAATKNATYPTEGRTRWTRHLKATATAIELREAMEEDLGTGELYVSRKGIFDSIGGGYQWNITFAGIQREFFEGIPPVVADGSSLVGPGQPRIKVSQLNTRPRYVRGNGHIFVRVPDPESDSGAKTFVEQSLVRPYNFQRQDLFGYSAALHGDIAAIGAPNSDSENPGVNSGAVSAYDLSFLSLEFAESPVNVTEGESIDLMLRRRIEGEGISVQLSNRRLYAFVYTLARNADLTTQFWWKTLYNLRDGRAIPPGQTAADVIGAGKAHGRAQYYGSHSNASAWVDGGRDDIGVSDFVPLGLQTVLPPGTDLISVAFESINDMIREVPDESTDVILWMPGMVSSPLGSQQVRITIMDDGDGLDGAAFTSFDKLGISSVPLVEKTISPSETRQGIAKRTTRSYNYYNERRAATVSTAFVERVDGNDETVIVLGSAKAEEVLVYRQSLGLWNFEAELASKMAANETSDDQNDFLPLRGQSELFGSAVAAEVTNGRDDRSATIVVGAPGAAEVYVFERALSSSIVTTIENSTVAANASNALQWVFSARLTHRAEAIEARHEFGGAVAIDGEAIAVGAAGLETVYVFMRSWNGESFSWETTAAHVLRSSDYDYDVLLGGMIVSMHVQGFGSSVAMSNNVLAVGAPYADYGNRGSTTDRETRDTNGVDNRKLGKGKVYVFRSSAPSLKITVRSDGVLSNGTWTLGLPYFRDVSGCETLELQRDASAADVKMALETACVSKGRIVGKIRVSRDSTWIATQTGGERLTWTVTFEGESRSPPPMRARWRGYGCSSCAAFDVEWSLAPWRQVAIDDERDRGMMIEEAVLQASDKTSSSAFGSALALDDDLLVVGAPRAPGAAKTTWDFETGDLQGWQYTGDAFVDQPTFGDGPASRQDTENNVLGQASSLSLEGGRPRSARPRGRYFIATKDARPGAGREEYRHPFPGTEKGQSDGSDIAIGTLTSEAVPIPVECRNCFLSFLVGGGCNPLAVYVELLVDGVAVSRETGRCDERMYNATWDVSDFAGRAAIIRIVDASQSNWGHINVDQFTFSWLNRGHGQGEIFLPESSSSKANFASGGRWAGLVSQSGAAYVFRNRNEWNFQSRLVPSDRRSGDSFGAAVAVDAANGLIAVGAPFADASSHWRLPPPKRPVGAGPRRQLPIDPSTYADVAEAYVNSDKPTRATPVKLPMEAEQSFRLFKSSSTTSVFEPSGARAVWARLALDRTKGIAPLASSQATDEARDAGAVYVFDETHTGQWSGFELAKLQSPSLFARDYFGKSVALLPDLLLAGAPGDDAFGENAGAAFPFDPHVLRLRFSQPEFSFVEGQSDQGARIVVERDAEDAVVDVTFAFSTEDLSAKGVDAEKVAACNDLSLRSNTREGCGDYQQTMGTVTIQKGDTFGAFFIVIVDDRCREQYSEYVQLTLSIPGAPALLGENFIARLRIDDDDFVEDTCTHDFL